MPARIPARKTATAPSAGRPKYRLALADPPWRYRATGSRMAPSYAGNGRASAHYETMSDEEIADVLAASADDLAPDCIGLLWITNSMLLEARHLPLLKAWRMVGVQVLPWIKTTAASGSVSIGGGSYTRAVSEHLILAQRPERGIEIHDTARSQLGLALDMREGPAGGEHSLILARRGRAAALVQHRGIAGMLIGPPAERRHSSKPALQYELAEALVDGPYLELFARRSRAGWDARGNQVDEPSRLPAPRPVRPAQGESGAVAQA